MLWQRQLIHDQTLRSYLQSAESLVRWSEALWKGMRSSGQVGELLEWGRRESLADLNVLIKKVAKSPAVREEGEERGARL